MAKAERIDPRLIPKLLRPQLAAFCLNPQPVENGDKPLGQKPSAPTAAPKPNKCVGGSSLPDRQDLNRRRRPQLAMV